MLSYEEHCSAIAAEPFNPSFSHCHLLPSFAVTVALRSVGNPSLDLSVFGSESLVSAGLMKCAAIQILLNAEAASEKEKTWFKKLTRTAPRSWPL